MDGWERQMHEALPRLVRQHVFDWEAVARELTAMGGDSLDGYSRDSRRVTADDARMGWAQMDAQSYTRGVGRDGATRREQVREASVEPPQAPAAESARGTASASSETGEAAVTAPAPGSEPTLHQALAALAARRDALREQRQSLFARVLTSMGEVEGSADVPDPRLLDGFGGPGPQQDPRSVPAAVNPTSHAGRGSDAPAPDPTSRPVGDAGGRGGGRPEADLADLERAFFEATGSDSLGPGALAGRDLPSSSVVLESPFDAWLAQDLEAWERRGEGEAKADSDGFEEEDKGAVSVREVNLEEGGSELGR